MPISQKRIIETPFEGCEVDSLDQDIKVTTCTCSGADGAAMLCDNASSIVGSA